MGERRGTIHQQRVKGSGRLFSSGINSDDMTISGGFLPVLLLFIFLTALTLPVLLSGAIELTINHHAILDSFDCSENSELFTSF